MLGDGGDPASGVKSRSGNAIFEGQGDDDPIKFSRPSTIEPGSNGKLPTEAFTHPD